MAGKVKGIWSTIVTDVEALIPVELKSELGGLLGTSFVASIIYDAKQLGASVESLAQADFASIYSAVKATAASVMTDPVLDQELFSGQIGAAVTELMTDAAKSLVPALEVIGKTTLTSLTTIVMELLITGAPIVVPPPAAAPVVPPTPAP